jgi:tRNA nucleotidyltransferase/poly(A) polymerase
MPDYIYLLENRLSYDQRHALAQLREAAREAGTILFLTGDAVRELTSGHAVRSLEVALHGNALKLKKSIAQLGGKVWGEHEPTQSLYLCFPGTVRVDLVSTHTVSYPKPGKPVYAPASIQEDLRRRDFTVNAMAISLNEGSFGLLMDPLNGAADIETRTLRLVSNYGFIEDPSLMIRATRYRARLGWEMDVRTQSRYEDAKAEGMIEAITSHALSQELEQIGHEEEALAVLRALEAEGWMKTLFPAWTAAKADEEKLKALHELAVDLLVQGVHADTSAAQMQLLTAKLAAKDLATLKKTLLRPGFVEEWDSLDSMAATFQKVLLAKENASASATYKLFTSYDPEAVLWLGFTSKNAAVQERYTQFLKVWPEVRQRIPYALMQEMRITPELANYNELIEGVFLELIDGKLGTPEEIKAYLEPFSPPAPPPKETIKRSRPRRSAEAKIKEQSFDDEEDSDSIHGDDEEDLDDLGGDDEMEIDLKLGHDEMDSEDIADDEEDADEEPPAKPAKAGRKAAEPKKAAPAEPTAKPIPTKGKPAPAAKPAPEPKAKTVPEPKAKPQPAAAKSKPSAAPAKTAPAKAAPAAKPAAKVPAKPAPKAAAKPAPAAKTKPAAKPAPAVKAKPAAKHAVPVKKAVLTKAKPKPAPAKPAAKKPAPKPAKKR